MEETNLAFRQYTVLVHCENKLKHAKFLGQGRPGLISPLWSPICFRPKNESNRQKRPICFHLLIGSDDHGVLRGNKFCFLCTACVIGRPHHTLTLTVPRRLPLSDPGRQSATTTETRAEGAGGKGGHSLEEHPLPKYHFRWRQKRRKT